MHTCYFDVLDWICVWLCVVTAARAGSAWTQRSFGQTMPCNMFLWKRWRCRTFQGLAGKLWCQCRRRYLVESMLKDTSFLALIIHDVYASLPFIALCLRNQDFDWSRNLPAVTTTHSLARQKLAAITFKRRYIGTDGYSPVQNNVLPFHPPSRISQLDVFARETFVLQYLFITTALYCTVIFSNH